MADMKTNSNRQDASAATPPASCNPDRPGGEESHSDKTSKPSLEELLHYATESKDRQEQSAPAAKPDSFGDTAETIQSPPVSGRAKGKSRSLRQRKACAVGAGAGETRQKIMMGLIPVLVIGLVFVVKNPLKVSAVPAAQDTESGPAVPAAGSDIEIDWRIPPLYLPGSRDPMQLPPPSTPSADEADDAAPAPIQTRVGPIVNGILFSRDRPAAIIDTRLVHEGEQVSGATIKKIEIDGVQFEMNGQTWKQAVDKR